MYLSTLAVNGCEYEHSKHGKYKYTLFGVFFSGKNDTSKINSIITNQNFIGMMFNDVMMFAFIFFTALGTVLIFEWTVLENVY